MSYSSLDKMTENYERFKKRIHPDNNSNSEESRERFQELKEAYAVLSDSNHRNQYDQHLKKTQISEASNFYEVLGVLSNSSAEQIRRAYQELRSHIHPDRNNNNKESNERFKELKKAFGTLADPVLRFKHNASLKKSYVIPHLKRVKETERNLREKVQDGQEPSETAKTGMYERGTAELKLGTEDDKDDLETAIWNEQVFQLAKYLEEEGGEGNIKEAISWYRRLAHENHLQAAWQLARLLEDRDIKEALYRYTQVQNLDSDGDLAHSSVFRQAQLYQTGVYKEKKALLSPDPEKASLFYEEAFRLGVPQQEIAAQYDRLHDYQMAMEWQQRERNNQSPQQLQESIKESNLMKIHFMTGTPFTPGWNETPYFPNGLFAMHEKIGISARAKKYSTDLHLAIRYRDGYAALGEKQEAVIGMIHSLSNKVDINARDGQGRTPLRLAIPRWYFQAVQLLLEMGADVNIPDKDGNIALATALRLWYSPRINAYTNVRDRELIQYTFSSLIKKSDLSVRNKRKQLPLYLAVRYRHPEAAAEIIQNGGAGKSHK